MWFTPKWNRFHSISNAYISIWAKWKKFHLFEISFLDRLKFIFKFLILNLWSILRQNKFGNKQVKQNFSWKQKTVFPKSTMYLNFDSLSSNFYVFLRFFFYPYNQQVEPTPTKTPRNYLSSPSLPFNYNFFLTSTRIFLATATENCFSALHYHVENKNYILSIFWVARNNLGL